jgi:iron complex transport system permease protein
MVALIVSESGVIGFIGLVVPHIVRLIIGSDNRRMIPFSILGGIIFMLSSDIISRTLIPPAEIPVGSITALIGSPFFIYLLFNAKKRLKQ